VVKGSVPYLLPFEGAKWAVRVTLPKPGTPSLCPSCSRPFALHGIACQTLQTAPDDRERLGALLEAAGGALQAVGARERLAGALRSAPADPLEHALALLAVCAEEGVVTGPLLNRIFSFLERETSADIRRAWRGRRA
jgi:hypothetical protein